MEAAAKFKEMALASKDAMEEFNDFAEDRATSWAFDEIRRLTALCEEQGKQIAFDCSSHQCDRIYDLASPHIEACLKAESALSQAREEVAAKQWVVDVLAEDLKGWKARAEAAEQREKGLREDAERWRALIGCARVRVLGSAGIVTANDQGYAHIGLEIWTHHTASSEPEAIEWLTKFADKAKAALAAASKIP